MTGQLGTGLLSGKNLLITGVITEASMAFHTARLAQEQGATVILTGFGRLSLVERIAKRLPSAAPVVELDVTDKSQLDSLADRVGEFVPRLDGVLHSIGFAPATALGGVFLETPWEDVATTMHASAFSLKSLAVAALPLMTPAAASSDWTSTPGRPGRPTTGWASRRRRWNLPAGTWPVISASKESG